MFNESVSNIHKNWIIETHFNQISDSVTVTIHHLDKSCKFYTQFHLNLRLQIIIIIESSKLRRFEEAFWFSGLTQVRQRIQADPQTETKYKGMRLRFTYCWTQLSSTHIQQNQPYLLLTPLLPSPLSPEGPALSKQTTNTQ